MKQDIHWYDYLTLNIYWLGINVASGTITPVLLPYLVALFVPADVKNTYLATIRVVGLSVAMLIQPLAGLLSDRSTHPLGRRRPYIAGATAFSLLFLLIIGAAPSFAASATDSLFQRLFGVSTAYLVLLAGTVLLQASSNVAMGALQGLIPDLVPERQRGRASGVKTVMEFVLPAFLVIPIGWLVDGGQIWLTTGIVMAAFLVAALITWFGVREQPLAVKPSAGIREQVWRLVALTAVFVGVTRLTLWLVTYGSAQLSQRGATLELQIVVVGLAGLVAMAASIFIGVYLGAWVGIGKQARQQTSFIWWVINRLLFLAGVGSIQGTALYFLSDTLHIENAATMTTMLMAVVVVFLFISALGGGYLADRVGRKRLVALSALIAAGGACLLLFSHTIPLILVSGSIIGIGTGTFMATNWALGTDLIPPAEAGRYLGISNLAGAGAGIVGAGIGGPMADFFNRLQPGLGYLVIFGIYGALFLLSVMALTQVKEGGASQ